MRSGIEILQATERTLSETCACNRERCKVCQQRREIAEYLEIASPRREEQGGAR